ncbi:LysM peptidoglycan-binding domain-containing protein [Hymenobacter negativus]|uniref:LysM peptidoglycan-binding domain-containing protein n=1 Tax=Hymenobacter negativus TaxID=2795026 RepID=A0ABS0Q6I1_9BACT|nr:LysM peptidoglycan-binding domain-containing protein [Hymenobacter negativus]MBH8558182.1 LysM peptidoglycan-binding domain-containing protein [Hymenobacter negativus]
MRNSILLLGILLTFTGTLAAQPLASRPHPDVPAAMDVAGIHLVLSEEAQRLVQQKADGLCRHQPSFQARVDLADASFPIIDRVLKEEGVPLDFRYLALQESALLGNARSNHEAVGYWQLKQETATGLGLTVNSAVDERQHLTTSTRAAARYLTRSNTSLHNWLNALLSYYTGPAGVKPYTLPTDFDATEMAITEATSPYVLMFLAQKVAFEPACGLNPRPKLLLQEFPAVAGQTLYDQALTLHVDSAALATHNHWLLAAAVPADKAYTLIVPVGDITQAAGIVANQRLQSRGQLLNAPTVAANAAEVRLNNLRALIALPGETMADLAKRGHQRLGEFLKHNELSAFDQVVTGRPYFLEKKRDVAAVEYHVLQPGERIFDVAQKYGIRQKAIYSKNRMARVEELRPGRVLWLQHTRPRETAIEYRSQPEGAALERPSVATTAAETETDNLVDQANEAVAARRTESGNDGKVKVKIKVKSDTGKTKPVSTESTDGWGEALETATTTAATVPAAAPAPEPVVPASVAPAPAPARAAPTPARPAPAAAPTQPSFAKRTYLPPPAAAPAPAPLADEPRQPDSTVAVPAVSRPAVVAKPVNAPTAPVYVPKPAPVKVAAPAVSAPAAVTPKPEAASAPTVAAATPKPATVAVRAIPSDATHRVEARETVYSVGRLYNISPATLIAINQLAPPYGLVTGQVLTLKAPEQQTAPAAKAAPAPAPAQVPAAHASGQINPALLYVPKKGVPAAKTVVAPAAPVAEVATQHTVAKGETLYSIAKRYQVTVADLQAWNNKPDASVKLGEVLRVQADTK